MKKLIIVLLSMIILLTGCGGSDKPFSQLDTDEQESYAWLMAQNVVKENLKSPSSAKFPSQLKASIKSIGVNKYKVSSYVEAENSFGASLKTNFVVTIEINDTYSKSHGGYSYSGDCQILE